MPAPDQLLSTMSDIFDANGKVQNWAMVRIKNPEGGKMFTGPQALYAGQQFHIPPGSEAIVPYYAMVLWMGDPRTQDVPGDQQRRYRTDEWRRLRANYGIYDESEPRLHENFPTIQAENVSGQRITTVLDDPFGEQVYENAASASQESQLQYYQEALEQNRAQMAQLQAQVDTLVKAQSGVTSDGLSEESIGKAMGDLSTTHAQPDARPVENPMTDGGIPVDETEQVPVGPKPSTKIPTQKPMGVL